MDCQKRSVRNMLRKAMLLVLAVAMMLFFSVPLSFADSITTGSTTSTITSAEFVIGMNQYFVNDVTPGISMDAAPYIDANSGRTLVPVRYLGDALGATTGWDGNTQTVTVTGGSTTVSLVIGGTAMMVNSQAQTLDQAPVIKDGRTYLPARWVANALGYQVDWNAANKIVIIWPIGTTEPGIVGNVVNGFVVPAGTKLLTTDSQDSLDMTGANPDAMAFTINTKNGDVKGQLADAQYILSQASCLDPATVSKVMTVINSDMAGTTMEQGYINSSSGGGVLLAAYGNWWFNIQIGTKPAPAGAYMLK
jgi:hypothetical protein